MPGQDSQIALAEWAVTCDALARGEQLLLLREGDLGTTDRAPPLPHERFWLYPTWEDQCLSDVTDPYRDRVRRLLELHRDDGRVRLKYHATVEYAERVESLARLLALDGEHTLNAAAVEARFRRRPAGAWLVLLRIRERGATAVLDPAAGSEDPEVDGRPPGPWLHLPAPVPEEGLEPVIPDRRFLREKARLLGTSGAVRAV